MSGPDEPSADLPPPPDPLADIAAAKADSEVAHAELHEKDAARIDALREALREVVDAHEASDGPRFDAAIAEAKRLLAGE
jgi:hypothetical protein